MWDCGVCGTTENQADVACVCGFERDQSEAVATHIERRARELAREEIAAFCERIIKWPQASGIVAHILAVENLKLQLKPKPKFPKRSEVFDMAGVNYLASHCEKIAKANGFEFWCWDKSQPTWDVHNPTKGLVCRVSDLED